MPAETVRVFDQDAIGLRLEEDEVCLQLSPVNLERQPFAVVQHDFRFGDVFGGDCVQTQRRSFKTFNISFRNRH